MTDDTIRASPTQASERLAHVDILRGLALLGILVVNFWAYQTTLLGWDERLALASESLHDTVAAWFVYVFASDKFWSSFSFLFGLGFVLLAERLEGRGVPYLPVYLRRLLVLFGFGLLHMLLWPEDILRLFALAGILLVAARRVPVRLIPVLAVALIAIQYVTHGFEVWERFEGSPAPGEQVVESAPGVESDERRQERIFRQADGSFSEIVRENLALTRSWYLSSTSWENWMSLLGMEFAFMLLGVYAGRRRFFHRVGDYLPVFRGVLKWGLAVAIVGQGIMILSRMNGGYSSGGFWVHMVADIAWAYGSGALALVYIAGMTLLLRDERRLLLFAPVGAAGRLALTNYLMQTLIATSLLYGHGLGLAPRVGAAGSFWLAIVLFGLQVLFSHFWIRSFRFGPAEWVWRSLTYGRRQPLRMR